MELKLPTNRTYHCFRFVLIVPLWNWNYPQQTSEESPCSSNRTFMELKLTTTMVMITRLTVLIVPLWNWNIYRSRIAAMEWGVLIVPLWNWNLKETSFHFCKASVLIVPLWNWNSISVRDSRADWGSNRTFMELKCNNDYFYGVRWDTCIKK